jgi:hypothetical protein
VAVFSPPPDDFRAEGLYRGGGWARCEGELAWLLIPVNECIPKFCGKPASRICRPFDSIYDRGCWALMKRGHKPEIGLLAAGGARKAKRCGHPVGERRTRRSQMVWIFFPTRGRTLGPFILDDEPREIENAEANQVEALSLVTQDKRIELRIILYTSECLMDHHPIGVAACLPACLFPRPAASILLSHHVVCLPFYYPVRTARSVILLWKYGSTSTPWRSYLRLTRVAHTPSEDIRP